MFFGSTCLHENITVETNACVKDRLTQSSAINFIGQHGSLVVSVSHSES